MRPFPALRHALVIAATLVAWSTARPASAQTGHIPAEAKGPDYILFRSAKVDPPTIHGRSYAPPVFPPGDPHHEVMEDLRVVMEQSCRSCHANGLPTKDTRAEEILGLSIRPVDETLREQLKLEKGGLVVTSVAEGSAAQRAGLQAKDILLTAAGKPLAAVADFRAAVGAVARPVTLKPGQEVGFPERFAMTILRDGETVAVTVHAGSSAGVLATHERIASRSVRPSTTAANAEKPTTVAEKPTNYWIGVSTNPADATLRAHLKLTDGSGLVVSEVIDDSPAAKAKIRKNDVLVTAGSLPLKSSSPLKSNDDLMKSVQASRGGLIWIEIRRGGAPYRVSVRPEPRKDEAKVGPADPAKPEEGATVHPTWKYSMHYTPARGIVVNPDLKVTEIKPGDYAWPAYIAPLFAVDPQAARPNPSAAKPSQPTAGLDARVENLAGSVARLDEAVRKLNELVKAQEKSDELIRELNRSLKRLNERDDAKGVKDR